MDAYPEAEAPPQSIVELVPVLIAVTDGGLRVLTVAQGTLLPNGPLSPPAQFPAGGRKAVGR